MTEITVNSLMTKFAAVRAKRAAAPPLLDKTTGQQLTYGQTPQVDGFNIYQAPSEWVWGQPRTFVGRSVDPRNSPITPHTGYQAHLFGAPVGPIASQGNTLPGPLTTGSSWLGSAIGALTGAAGMGALSDWTARRNRMAAIDADPQAFPMTTDLMRRQGDKDNPLMPAEKLFLKQVRKGMVPVQMPDPNARAGRIPHALDHELTNLLGAQALDQTARYNRSLHYPFPNPLTGQSSQPNMTAIYPRGQGPTDPRAVRFSEVKGAPNSSKTVSVTPITDQRATLGRMLIDRANATATKPEHYAATTAPVSVDMRPATKEMGWLQRMRTHGQTVNTNIHAGHQNWLAHAARNYKLPMGIGAAAGMGLGALTSLPTHGQVPSSGGWQPMPGLALPSIPEPPPAK